MSAPTNPEQNPVGAWVILGWPANSDPETDTPSTVVEVEHGGRGLADLIVASLQATSKAAENALAAHAAGTRGIDPRGWRYGPACATCHDTGTVNTPELPGWSGHCNCKRGRRLLDLHLWEKARDNAEHEQQLAALSGGREQPDDSYVDPSGAPF
jgi:hypothetical protein